MERRSASSPKIVFAGSYGGNENFPVHKHESAWELIYLREGQISEIVDESVLEMHPGMFVVHPPATRHGDLATSNYRIYHVQITHDGPLNWPLHGTDIEGGPLGEILGLIVQEWYSGWSQREAFLRHCSSLLDILIKRCATRNVETKRALGIVMEARGIFRRDFQGPISLNEIAEQLNISRSTLYESFHQVLGRTPHDVLDEIRLRHAVYLLKDTRFTVAEVARGSGYSSASHLGRKLRAAYQMSAREVRLSVPKRGKSSPG